MAGPIYHSARKSRTRGEIVEEAVPQNFYETGEVNVSVPERIASLAIGGALIGYGFVGSSLPLRILSFIGGGALLPRGVTGHCSMYHALGFNTASGKGHSIRGINVVRSCVVDCTPEEAYDFWCDFDRLPEFLSHLESVEVLGDDRSHWVARGPLGTRFEWDAVVTKDVENELIGWRSVEGSDIENAGSVRFEPTEDGKCRITVALRYDPPAGMAGYAVAKLLGEEPGQQIEDDLERLAEILEGRSTGRVEEAEARSGAAKTDRTNGEQGPSEVR